MLKNNVLRKNSDFNAIYKKGRSVGDSVKRNRAKRLMKESYRAISYMLPEGYDFIIIARNTICGKKCAEVEKSLLSAFKRTGVIREK